MNTSGNTNTEQPAEAMLDEYVYPTNNGLYVNVEFNDLLSMHGETEAFRIVGVLKDLLR